MTCTSLEVPEPVHPVDSFRSHQSGTQLPLQVTHSGSRLSRNQSPAKVNPALWGGSLHSWLLVKAILAADQPGDKSLPLLRQQQSRLNYKRKVYTAREGAHLQCPVWVIGEAVPSNPTEHLLHTGTLPRQRDIAALPVHRNKHREAAKMRTQRNMPQMKEQNKTPEKELNKMETSKLLDAEFKTLVIRMLSALKGRADELSENFKKEGRNIKADLGSVKRYQSK